MTEPTDWLNECREALIELRDQQALPRKAASYQRQIDELDAHIASGGWQDISTAPKDGTSFLALTAQGQQRVDWREVERQGPWVASGNQLLLFWQEKPGDRYTHWKPLDCRQYRPEPPMPENTPKASAAIFDLSHHVWAGFVQCGHAPVPWNPGFWREVHRGR